MANFLGLPLRIEFQQGGHVEGILAAIDGSSGTLTVENATRTQPNGRSTQITVLVIPRDKIANLSLLSVTLNGAAEPNETPAVAQTTPSAISRNDYLSPPKSKQNSPASSRSGRQRKQSPKAAPVNLLSGSEADESGVTLDEADTSAATAVSSSGASSGRRNRKRSDRRKSSSSTVKFAPSPVQDVPTETSGYTDFDSDFDFSRGLRSFDKAQVFAEIRNADQTDPALRLHSHNRRVDRYTTKLGIHESVLDTQTEDNSPQMKARTLTINPRTDDDEETVVGIATPTSSTFRTLDGVVCPALSWKQWKDALQLASIEVGPNLLQRTENGARGIADFILQKVGPKVIVILCGATSSKAGFGLRAGAHLTNKGATVFCWLTPGDTLPASLEFHLRLFSASGGRVVRSSSALPANPDMILDALADNDNDKARKQHASEGEAALYANNLSSRVISVDLPSGLDPDTGSSIGTWCIRPAYTLALGCVKLAHRLEGTVGETHIVDVGLPQSAFERGALIATWPKSLFGTSWIVECQRT